jgi:hypothetical protein
MFSAVANMNQFDPDAGAFINATLIGGIEAVAINNLVNQLKTAGLWDSFNAIYPFVGGTAYTHQFNLKNPQNSDAAYRITWNGTITHNANGITPNGTDGYGNLYITPATWGGGTDNVHMSMYVRTLTARNGTDCGSNNGTNYTFFNPRNASNNVAYTVNTNSTATTVAFTGTSGFFGISRLNSSNQVLTVNTTQTSAARTSVSSAANTRSFAIGAYNNNGSVGNFQNRNYALLTLGYGLSDANMDTLSSINETFQKTLGRFV